MAPPVLRPENALKRADELISVGEPQAALQSLYEYLSSKKIRSLEPSTLEPIVFKFLELGVTLKRGKVIKDGLYQYKKNMQITTEGLNSVGSVSRKFIDLIENKMAKEQVKAEEEQTAEEDDLEGGITPDNLLISVYQQDQSVSGFNDKAVTSWLRFTWESYRTTLDLLRNNSQLEVTYSGVVSRTMQFCLKYNRKNEFKRLVEMLRQHLDAANYQQQKYGHHTVDLSDPDTLQRYLDQRFQQVNVSVKLELWHEAFRSLEDVHHLMEMSKHAPRPFQLANYYENLAKIFLTSGNYLLNSAAWEKFYKLYLSNPNADDDDFRCYSSQFLLSALSIQADDLPVVGYDPQVRLCNLLNLSSKPTRQQMINLATEDHIYSKVDEDIKRLYNLVNNQFDITDIKDKLGELVPSLESKPYFKQYVIPLKNYILRKVFVDVSKLFDSINFEELFQLCALPSPFNVTRLEMEKCLMQAAMDDYVSFTIDHETNFINFIKDPFDVLTSSSTPIDDIVDDIINENEDEGSHSSIEDDEEPEPVITRNTAIRAQLSELAKILKETEGFSEFSYMQKVKLAREELIAQTNKVIAREKEAADERTMQLEERQRLEAERALTAEQVVEERQRRMMEEKTTADARMQAEARRRAEEKQEREKEAIRLSEMKKLIQETNAKGVIYINPDEAKNLDADKIRQMTFDQLSKDKKDLDERTAYAFKKIDHTERAYRRVELPLLDKDADLQKEKDRVNYDQLKDRLTNLAKVEHQNGVKLNERLMKMSADYAHYKSKIISIKESKLAKKRAENMLKFEAAKMARIEEVRQKRYEEISARYEAENRAREEQKEYEKREEVRRQAEVEKAERLARMREERSRINREKDELSRKQREMEEAIERKLTGKTSAISGNSKPLTFAEKMKLKKAGLLSQEDGNEPLKPVTPTTSFSSNPDTAKVDVTKLSFAEKMKLKRDGKV